MLCSIVIPLYNKEAYIAAAIQSVQAQDYQEVEIVVINDGSRDGGPAIVAEMARQDTRIRLISQPNGGVSRARNAGIDEARGELVLFLDADDWYAPTYVSTVVSMARSQPQRSFFATGYQRVRGDSTATWERREAPFELVENYYERRWREGPFFFTSSLAARRVDLLALQPCFPPGDSFGEDQDLFFRLAEHLTLVFCPAQLVAYRIEVAGSLSAIHDYIVLPPTFLRLESRARQGLLGAVRGRSAMALVADARVSVARYALSHGRRMEAIREMLRARHGVRSLHWWVALTMCLSFSQAMVRRWESWRAGKAAA